MGEAIRSIKPLGDKSKKLRTINRKISKKLNKGKEIPFTIISPDTLVAGLRKIYLLLLIPAVILVGVIDGLCFGFTKGMSVALSLYKKQLYTNDWLE